MMRYEILVNVILISDLFQTRTLVPSLIAKALSSKLAQHPGQSKGKSGIEPLSLSCLTSAVFWSITVSLLTSILTSLKAAQSEGSLNIRFKFEKFVNANSLIWHINYTTVSLSPY